jgi:hypothetical protein
MRDALGPGTVLGYCTNVHAWRSARQVERGLHRLAAKVRALAHPGGTMGIGLWLPPRAAREVARPGEAERLGDRLRDLGLEAFTINAFPCLDFHRRLVRHAVYEPDWADERRLEYTLLVADILRRLGGAEEGSISTLPLGWRARMPAGRIEVAIGALARLAHALRAAHEKDGRLVHVDLEPEPGCALETSGDAEAVFERLRRAAGEWVTEYIRICHDVCHAAVMFEDQRRCMEGYAAAGARVGKVQVSSGVSARFDEMGREDLLRALEAFEDRRYLHQVCARDEEGRTRVYEDLSTALREAPARGEWRVHFHVPVFLERIGALATTNGEIGGAVRAAIEVHGTRHFEVETYAWGVLPEPARGRALARGIARELGWTRGAGACRAAPAPAAKGARGSYVRAIAELTRAANLPTCVSGALTGVILGGGAGALAWAAPGIALMYAGGAALNDAIDSPRDARRRPGRAIPSGLIPRTLGFAIAGAGLAAGAALLGVGGPAAVAWALALAGAIVAYDLAHARTRLGAALMGVCRGLVYPASAAAAGAQQVHGALPWMGLALGAHVSVFTLAAKARAGRERAWLGGAALALPLATLPVALVSPPRDITPMLAAALAMAGWHGWAGMQFIAGRTTRGVHAWIAGIALVDAYFLALLDEPAWACVAGGMFVCTLVAQRLARGT